MDAENHSNSLRGRTSGRGRAPKKDRTADGVDPREAVAVAIRAAFRSRIGEDRHDVWFGEHFEVHAERGVDGERVVTILAGTAFTHDWLLRTFRDDFAAAVEQVLGKSGGPTRVAWNPLVAGAEATGAKAPATSILETGISSATGDGAQARNAIIGRGQPMPAGRPSARPRRGVLAGAARPSAPAAADDVRFERPAAAPRGMSPIVAAPGGGDQGQGSTRLTAPVRPALTLEQYVVGLGNRMAHAAAVLAAEQPGAMSPLVIHGPSGVGKTHLLEGTCRRMRERNPRSSTVMLSAEQFTTTFLESLHGRRGLPGFRRTLRSADLLVIDDIQFLIGKKATISELLHTLEALQRAGKQVVFGSDRDVESLAELGSDLQARLRGGMCARILPPDEATRAGIVESLAARRGLPIPADVVAFVAARMTRNTRELAGAVNRLEATSHMLGIPVTLDMAEECLAELVRSSSRAVRLADIERAVCSALGVDPGSLQSSCRVRRVNQPRMLAMFLARKHTPAALAEIGAYFGRRSHSTVISAQRTVDGWIASGSRLTLADAEWGVEEAIRRVEESLRAG
jgi:chromosomal replication initiator protein